MSVSVISIMCVGNLFQSLMVLENSCFGMLSQMNKVRCNEVDDIVLWIVLLINSTEEMTEIIDDKILCAMYVI